MAAMPCFIDGNDLHLQPSSSSLLSLYFVPRPAQTPQSEDYALELRLAVVDSHLALVAAPEQAQTLLAISFCSLYTQQSTAV